MALFKRKNKKEDVLPAEVREYYQSERREKTGVAWLLAIVTLLVTFALAAALFFGGRWLYGVLFDSDTGSETTQQEEGLRVDENGNVEGAQAPDAQPDTTEEPAELPSSDTGFADTPTTQPTTGDTTPNRLINTGPDEEY